MEVQHIPTRHLKKPTACQSCVQFLIISRVLSKIDRKSTRLNSSHVETSYAVFCLKKKKHRTNDDRCEHYAAGDYAQRDHSPVRVDRLPPHLLQIPGHLHYEANAPADRR